ncbi:MAG: lysine--tRNA ligase [Candidatus Jorgensenbacteria bacterium]|nr:lysine--tRNA ligase [Candidatus Jorgensenbacteria bacterium]
MLEDLIHERRSKLERYAAVESPFPSRTHFAGKRTVISEVLKNFTSLARGGKPVAVAGRISGLRDQGKILFIDLRDASGSIQLVLNEKELGKNFALPKETVDIGDFIEARGAAFATKRGEKSILATGVHMLAKSIRPIPSERYGLEDAETRLRKRYLDLLSNDGVREIFVKKNAFWNAVRAFLTKENFLEVETPVLEPTPGGAEAEPFVTHHNALDTDFYLRISLELPLKKLLVGGFEKVFEIGRIFRNEGIDREHLQDYTQMECYWAYADYNDMMKFVEELYKKVITATLGAKKTTFGGKTIDWGKKWKTIDYYEVFKKASGFDIATASRDELFRKAKSLDIKIEPQAGLPAQAGKGRLIDAIYKKLVRPNLIEPCFLVNPPVEVEPLAKRVESDPARVERFQVVACGTELGKGFSELNDPIDQRKRFEEQMKLRAAGDKEAQRLDEDFLEALEYGMPPAAGFGMSERLFAVLLDKPVRETVLFPLMKKEK